MSESCRDLLRTLHDRALWKRDLRAPDPYLSERTGRREVRVEALRHSTRSMGELKPGKRREKLLLRENAFLVTGKCLVNRVSPSSLSQGQTSLHKSLESSSSLTPIRSLPNSLSFSTPRYMTGSLHLPKAMSGYQSQFTNHKATHSHSLFTNQRIERFLARFDSKPQPAIRLP